MSSVRRFELLPAIDLRGGRVVRLAHGDMDRETRYADDPIEVARTFVDAGAGWLHVVDLDGAVEGEPRQTGTIAAIVSAIRGRARCQVAGGLRTPAAVDRALADGAERVVLGTSALRDPAFAAAAVARHGSERVVVALDVRDGLALGEGWRPGAPGVAPEDALMGIAAGGVETFAVTAIERDGVLQGPDLELLGAMVRLGRGRIIASGGISSLEDLQAVAALGCAGAIVGTALYEGRIDLGAGARRGGATAGQLSRPGRISGRRSGSPRRPCGAPR